MTYPFKGDIVRVDVDKDLYGGFIQDVLHVVEQVLYEEYLVVSRVDGSLYYGEGFWIVSMEDVTVECSSPLSQEMIRKIA